MDLLPERGEGPHGRRSRLIWDRGRRHPRVTTIVATLGTFAAVVAPASAASTAFGATTVGAVYVASNSYAGNEILTFPRYADGSLGPVEAEAATGGKGSGAGSGSGALAAIQNDPLGSQGSLMVDPTGRFLYAVNAGSNDVSVFTVTPAGLKLVDREPSGGAYPVSLTAYGNTLYVLNAVGNSVTGFTVNGNGQLIRPTTCSLPPLPAGMDPLLPATAASSAQPVSTETAGQVGFSPDDASAHRSRNPICGCRISWSERARLAAEQARLAPPPPPEPTEAAHPASPHPPAPARGRSRKPAPDTTTEM